MAASTENALTGRFPTLGQTFPNIRASCTNTEQTPDGQLDLYEYMEEGWCMLFSHPAAFTPICTTELGMLAQAGPQFAERDCKLVGLSCDSAERDQAWLADIEAVNGGTPVVYPIIADEDRSLAVGLGMLEPESQDMAGVPLPARGVFFIGPDKKVKLALLYPATTGRNVDELLRLLDSLQLTAKHKVATPVNWKHGEACYLLPAVTPEAAAEKFPDMQVVAVPSEKPYLRQVPQPTS